MAFGRLSINARLFIIQIIIIVLLLCLRDVAREVNLNRQHVAKQLEDDDDDAQNAVRRRPEIRVRQDPDENPDHDDAQQLHKFVFDEWTNGRQSNTSTYEKFKQAGAFRCPTLRRTNRKIADLSGMSWLRERYRGRTQIYLYSVYSDTRAMSAYEGNHSYSHASRLSWGPPWLRLLVMASATVNGDSISSTKIYCHLWYSDVDMPVVVKSRVTKMAADGEAGENGGDTDSGMVEYISLSIDCPLPYSNGELFRDLQHVSLSVASECAEDDVASTLFPVPVHESRDVKMRLERGNNLAVCVAPVNKTSLESWSSMYNAAHEIQAPWLIEWMELMTLFGTRQVTMYTAFESTEHLSTSTRKLIEYYSNRKSLPHLVIRPLPFPVRRDSTNHRSHPTLDGVAFNDCLLRYSSGITFVAPFLSADEILIPRLKVSNYSSMFDLVDPSRRSVLSLKGATFSTDAVAAIDSESILTTVRFRSRNKVVPIDRHVVDPLRCSLMSASGLCLQLALGGSAVPQSDVFDMPQPVGILHRYRSCAMPRLCWEEKDNALMRFQQQLKLNLVQAMRDSGLVTGNDDVHALALKL